MEILLEDRKKTNQNTVQSNPTPGETFPQNGTSKKSKKNMIDVNEDYQFKKEMIDDLISEEKVLMALQQ